MMKDHIVYSDNGVSFTALIRGHFWRKGSKYKYYINISHRSKQKQDSHF